MVIDEELMRTLVVITACNIIYAIQYIYIYISVVSISQCFCYELFLFFNFLSLKKTSKGQELLDRVCEQVDLVEKDYYGLVYLDQDNNRNWLAADKKINKQLKSNTLRFHFLINELTKILCLGHPWEFNFEVKFYPPDPSQLQEDITRYQLCLQVRNDILSGKYVL